MTEENGNTEELATQNEGFVAQSLSRTTKQIRLDRGDIIAEELEVEYRREIENLTLEISRNRRVQSLYFDFSPNNTHSLVMKEVNGALIMKDDLKVELENRNLEIKLNLAKKRYNFLFGEKYKLEEIG